MHAAGPIAGRGTSRPIFKNSYIIGATFAREPSLTDHTGKPGTLAVDIRTLLNGG